MGRWQTASLHKDDIMQSELCSMFGDRTTRLSLGVFESISGWKLFGACRWEGERHFYLQRREYEIVEEFAKKNFPELWL